MPAAPGLVKGLLLERHFRVREREDCSVKTEPLGVDLDQQTCTGTFFSPFPPPQHQHPTHTTFGSTYRDRLSLGWLIQLTRQPHTITGFAVDNYAAAELHSPACPLILDRPRPIDTHQNSTPTAPPSPPQISLLQPSYINKPGLDWPVHTRA
ncbi:hypothetical protein PGTUg99_023311 [Puccinia graminis f. sp. tritici]|uniref:Uncharacterized protein n=1 Tax=Puccinia graminis f. sp. tritici TaxID=56615 RepID=A0A5B0Q8Y6_PUCGR|nr:hypothetical protein PGTUg99_023311 [Puccinia graminis f. sp. tritici]